MLFNQMIFTLIVSGPFFHSKHAMQTLSCPQMLAIPVIHAASASFNRDVMVNVLIVPVLAARHIYGATKQSFVQY
jgi:hypothetical protein